MMKESENQICDVVTLLRESNKQFSVIEPDSLLNEELVAKFHKIWSVDRWGKVIWESSNKIISFQYYTYAELTEVIVKAIKYLDFNHDDSLYVLWFDASKPILCVEFDALIEFFIEILDEDSDCVIISRDMSRCIENTHDGVLTIGAPSKRPLGDVPSKRPLDNG